MISRATTLPVSAELSITSSTDKFPRVLIVALSSINEHDQHAVSFRSWFAEWPRERLAQIYSGHEVGAARFCGHTFKLGPVERRFGRLFFLLKDSVIGASARPVTMTERFTGSLPRVTMLDLLTGRISSVIVDSGIWELIFQPVLSERLQKWVGMFKPDVIFVQGRMLSFTWLAQMLQKAFRVPICFQTDDDWPTHLYDNSFAAGAIRPIVRRAAASLIRSASVAIVNGETMAAEYTKRYGLQFTPVMYQCDAVDRFRAAMPKRFDGPNHISVVYSGNLAHGRWRLLADVCAAGRVLDQCGHQVSVTAFVSTVPKEAMIVLRSISNLQLLPAPTHEDVPSVLKGADILLLPETFDPVESERIRLSISTKAHLYMMSEKPILVYASPITGVADYATKEGWAVVVGRRDSAALVEALRALIDDQELRRRLVSRGMEVASRNHEQSVVRRRFLEHMRRAAGWAT